MECYEFIYNRQNKNGGDVAKNVYQNFNFKMVEAMTRAFDSLLGCLTDLHRKRRKISLMYTSPGSSIEIFRY